VISGEMPIKLGNSWLSTKCIEVQNLMGFEI